MNIIYVYIENCRGIKDKGILLNNNYEVDCKVKRKDLGGKLDVDIKVRKKDVFHSLYKDKNIIDSYLIVGKNGAGKSTLFDILSNKIESTDKRLQEEYNYFIVYDSDSVYGKDDYYIKMYNKDKFNKMIINDTDVITNIRNNTLEGSLGAYEFRKFVNKKEIDGYVYSIIPEKGMCSYRLNRFYTETEMINVKLISEGYSNDAGIFKFLWYYGQSKLLKNFDSKEIVIYNNLGLKKPVYRIGGICYNRKTIILSLATDYVHQLRERVLKNFKGKEKAIDREKFYSDFEVIFGDLKEVIKTFLENGLNENTKNDVKQVNEKIEKILEKKAYFHKNDEELLQFLLRIIHACGDYLKYNGSIFWLDMSSIIDNTGGFENNIIKERFDFIYSMLDFIEDGKSIFSLSYGGSNGERSMINLLSCIDFCARNILEQDAGEESKNVYLLLDEVELYLHPEWCRNLYSEIAEFFKIEYSKFHKFYIYITTHSPYIISDFTSDHIINLEEENNKMKIQSFGANIYEILKKGMFLNNSMGAFAYNKIKNIHKILSCKEEKTKENILILLEREGIKSEDELLYFIENIGEPIIKNKLRNLWNNLDENKYSVKDLEQKTKEELIEIIRGACDVKD